MLFKLGAWNEAFDRFASRATAFFRPSPFSNACPAISLSIERQAFGNGDDRPDLIAAASIRITSSARSIDAVYRAPRDFAAETL